MTCLLSFDIEDWFHAHNLLPAVSRSEWESCEARVVENTRRILDLLEKHDTRATFFVLGWIAERHPHLVEEIAEGGHEVASHGCNHELLYEQSREDVRADLHRSVEILRSIVDTPVLGYRAPSFSITDEAIEVLDELGFQYDSSSFAFSVHDRYGKLDTADTRSSGTFVRLANGLLEARLPQVDIPMTRRAIPWAGGGYFRFIPYSIYRRGVRRVAKTRPFIFYLHPWDLDPDQPRFASLPWSYRLRHYTNLDKTATRLDRLLADFDWKPIRDALPAGAQDN
ncbi:polysaccharide deacetylase family protein (PEP-CTERM system associated) [Salinibacter ruber]|uniref:XrtA system polysaccharide deacetylase n=1 Tax=Salinibacter ruber TaxID=146919 RepID=UPI00216837F1|nr:XrtA system polysaccharide deacetylase [Salinibacter ruber]MCS3749303.1 polysaccharide deacetylase family protein (PEP-CTERM system associated) [Salinibacter ruber]